MQKLISYTRTRDVTRTLIGGGGGGIFILFTTVDNRNTHGKYMLQKLIF